MQTRGCGQPGDVFLAGRIHVLLLLFRLSCAVTFFSTNISHNCLNELLQFFSSRASCRSSRRHARQMLTCVLVSLSVLQ